MAHKTMTIREVIDYIKNDDTLDDFSFRGDDYIPARSFRASRYHGDDFPEYKLGGVSAIKVAYCEDQYIIRAMTSARKYGDNLFLLRGQAINADEVNNDPGECLMQTHRIVCIVKAEA